MEVCVNRKSMSVSLSIAVTVNVLILLQIFVVTVILDMKADIVKTKCKKYDY